MNATKCLSIRDGKPFVTLPQSVSAIGIEPILRECYRKSLIKKYDAVSFSFESVTWCDVFSLSLLSLWIWELVQNGKEVKVLLPSSSGRFFEQYGFTDFLTKQGISPTQVRERASTAPARDLFIAPFYPLTFVTKSAFHDLLSDLHHGNRLETVLAEVSEANVVRTGAIRDVILKELGANMFLHADGKAAHFIMTKLPVRYPSSAASPEERSHTLTG